MALFSIDTEEAKRSAKKYFSLESFIENPYGVDYLRPYQDNRMGEWLTEVENYDLICSFNPAY